MIKRYAMGVALATALSLAAGGAWSASNDCGRVGTWTGETTGPGFQWIATDTPGMSATTGQMSLEFIVFPKGLILNYGADRLTNGKGVWEKVKQGEYEFSWVAYGVNTAATPMTTVYMIRVSGSILHDGCDEADISYTIEFFKPPGTLVSTSTGTATETRMRLP